MSYRLTKIKEVDARGGPPTIEKGPDGHPMTPTRAGRFVIRTIEKHVSMGRYGLWSGIPWGTPMRLNAHVTEVKIGRDWKRLTSVSMAWKRYSQEEIVEAINSYNKQLGFTRFPDKWIFNDFGHVSIKYFRDLNNNWRLDGKERILSDFIHTTPLDEAFTARAKPVSLAQSHGCIHVRPTDIDTLIGFGYIQKGKIIEVHDYNEKLVAYTLSRPNAKPGFEVHFYPAIYKIVVYKVEVIINQK